MGRKGIVWIQIVTAAVVAVALGTGAGSWAAKGGGESRNLCGRFAGFLGARLTNDGYDVEPPVGVDPYCDGKDGVENGLGPSNGSLIFWTADKTGNGTWQTGARRVFVDVAATGLSELTQFGGQPLVSGLYHVKTSKLSDENGGPMDLFALAKNAARNGGFRITVQYGTPASSGVRDLYLGFNAVNNPNLPAHHLVVTRTHDKNQGDPNSQWTIEAPALVPVRQVVEAASGTSTAIGWASMPFRLTLWPETGTQQPTP